ncbi:MAG: mono/diheme cytochrome c family protein, partial [Limisphaerales bacterium]
MILSERSHCLLLALLIGTAVTVAAIDLPTLDEVRAAGARQSSFRNRPATAVGPEAPPPALGRFRKEIEPVLKAHCVRCHGPEKAKANLRIDTLNPDLLKGRDVDWWLEILAVLGNGEMPPPDKSEMPGPERTKAIEWLAGEIRMASRVRRATEGHSSFRRMTRYEYNYALQDLLGLSLDFARDLPPEAHSEDGFQNSSETLHMSVMQLETYRRIARKALLRATVHGPRPPVLYWGVTMKKAAQIEWSQQQAKLAKLRDRFKDDPAKQKQELDRLIASFEKPPARAHFKDRSTGRTVRHAWDYRGAKHAFKPTSSRPKVPGAVDHVAVLPQGAKQKLVVELGEKLPDEGTLRVRVRASRTAAEEDRIPSLQLEFGWQASNEGRALLRVSNEDIPVAAGPDNPEFYQWEVPLGDIYPRNSVRQTSPLGSTPNPSEHIRLVNSSASRGDIQIDYVEVAAPVHDQWPPASHQRIFFDSKNRHDEPVYVREVLTAFMSRAWRRKVTAEEVGQKIRLFQAMRPSCDTFEEAVVETLATVLASPDFLYLVRDETVRSSGPPSGPARLSEHELATRLAMFLWCSLPDDRLLKLAGRGQLSRADVLAGEVTRMLEDSRSQRFAKHFVRQWLDMQLLDFLKPGKSLELLLKEAMLQEPIVFFREMLRRDESVLNFIHADYTM